MCTKAVAEPNVSIFFNESPLCCYSGSVCVGGIFLLGQIAFPPLTLFVVSGSGLFRQDNTAPLCSVFVWI